MRTIIRVKLRITFEQVLLAIVLPVILVEATILLLKQMSTFLSAAEKYDKLLAQLVKGHRSYLCLFTQSNGLPNIYVLRQSII